MTHVNKGIQLAGLLLICICGILKNGFMRLCSKHIFLPDGSSCQSHVTIMDGSAQTQSKWVAPVQGSLQL